MRACVCVPVCLCLQLLWVGQVFSGLSFGIRKKKKKVEPVPNASLITNIVNFVVRYRELLHAVEAQMKTLRLTTLHVMNCKGYEMNVDISNTAAVYESWNDLIPRLHELQQLAQEVFCTELFHVTTKLISGVDDSEMALLPASGDHTVRVTALRAQCKCVCVSSTCLFLFVCVCHVHR